MGACNEARTGYGRQEEATMRTLLLIACAWAFGTGSAAAQTFADPFDYCAAVGTIDAPDHRFVGRPPVAKMRKAFDIGPGFDHLQDRNFPWRCVSGAVWGCVWTNHEICVRADISRVPTKEISAFCRRERDAEFIPLAVAGHQPTMYEWTCRQGIATITRQLFTPDERGFSPDEWKKLSR